MFLFVLFSLPHFLPRSRVKRIATHQCTGSGTVPHGYFHGDTWDSFRESTLVQTGREWKREKTGDTSYVYVTTSTSTTEHRNSVGSLLTRLSKLLRYRDYRGISVTRWDLTKRELVESSTLFVGLRHEERALNENERTITFQPSVTHTFHLRQQ